MHNIERAGGFPLSKSGNLFILALFFSQLGSAVETSECKKIGQSSEGNILSCPCESKSFRISFTTPAVRRAPASVSDRRLGACGIPGNPNFIVHEKFFRVFPQIEACARQAFPNSPHDQIEMTTQRIYAGISRRSDSKESVHADALAADVTGFRLGTQWHPYSKIRKKISPNDACPSDNTTLCQEWEHWKRFFSCSAKHEMISLDEKQTSPNPHYFHIGPSIPR